MNRIMRFASCSYIEFAQIVEIFPVGDEWLSQMNGNSAGNALDRSAKPLVYPRHLTTTCGERFSGLLSVSGAE